MWKKAAVGAAALVIAGSMVVFAQQGPGGPGFEATRDMPGYGRWRPSTQDMSAFADARIAALHAGLQLNADQEKNWPAFEQALREFSKMRIDRVSAARDQQQQQTGDPIDRLQRRADRMTARGTALKRLADTAAPLYRSLDDAQKRRFTMLASVMREHQRHRMGMMGRERFGGGGMRGDEGGFRRFGDRPGMRGQDGGGMRGGRGDQDYRGPL